MRCGISTSCFFPDDTLESLHQVIACGAAVTEIFLNTFSELKPAYQKRLEDAVRASGIQVLSVHPFSSMLDGFFFASPYTARLYDGFDLYKQYFELCARLGAGKLVFHGDHKAPITPYPLERYAEHFIQLAELGKPYGVTLCHENVYYCRLGSPAVIREFRPLVAGHAAFVLDLKQVQRQGCSMAEMLAAMEPDIRHIHISDHRPDHDCIPPGQGAFDFPGFIEHLKESGYDGDLVIELYRDGFAAPEELTRSMAYVQGLIDG